jgi:hypothetical protein
VQSNGPADSVFGAVQSITLMPKVTRGIERCYNIDGSYSGSLNYGALPLLPLSGPKGITAL